MKNKSCCFTGHRVLPEKAIPEIEKNLEKTIHELIQCGITRFYAGGAIGFDYLASMKIVELKNTYPEIELFLILPCKNQTIGWNTLEQKKHKMLEILADEVLCLSTFYYEGCMHTRNRELVKRSSVCVAYCNKLQGGTAYTLGYAKAQGLEIYNLARN